MSQCVELSRLATIHSPDIIHAGGLLTNGQHGHSGRHCEYLACLTQET